MPHHPDNIEQHLSMEADVFENGICVADPVMKLAASRNALQLTGNEQLLRIPKLYLPQCADLNVNDESTNFKVSVKKLNSHEFVDTQNDAAYLQFAASLTDNCSETAQQTDLLFSLIADGNCHSLGSLSPDVVNTLSQFYQNNLVQTQQLQEGTGGIPIWFKATCDDGNIDLYVSDTCTSDTHMMNVPLKDFMNTCYSAANPFPGVTSLNSKTRNLHTLRTVIDNLLAAQSEPESHLASRDQAKPITMPGLGRKPMSTFRPPILADTLEVPGENQIKSIPEARSVHHALNSRRFIKSDVPIDFPSANLGHFVRYLGEVNNKLAAREADGLPISYSLTCSKPVSDSLSDGLPTFYQPEPLPEKGHPKPGCHGGLKFGPHEQTMGLIILAVLAALIVLKMIKSSKGVPATLPPYQPEMQKKSKQEYSSVPTEQI